MAAARRDEFETYRDERGGISIIEPPRFLPHLVLWLVLIGGGLAATHYFAGAGVVEGILASLANPLAIAWVLLFFAAYWITMWRIRLGATICWLSWLGLTAAGSSFTANALITRLERPYLAVDPLQLDKFDAILVLGGGTDTTPAGLPQLDFVGDRLALAARLYHAGNVDRIIVSGVRRRPLAANELQYFEESRRILRDLQVPDDDIVALESGTDTSREVQSLKAWTSEQANPLRIGLLTSAWHLPRALMLAERYQVEVVPVPANFLSETFHLGPGSFIPSGQPLFVSQLAIREFVGLKFDR
jgi:uncharacterized SAM-binding protein YcdF (DUF218 family)